MSMEPQVTIDLKEYEVLKRNARNIHGQFELIVLEYGTTTIRATLVARDSDASSAAEKCMNILEKRLVSLLDEKAEERGKDRSWWQRIFSIDTRSILPPSENEQP